MMRRVIIKILRTKYLLVFSDELAQLWPRLVDDGLQIEGMHNTTLTRLAGVLHQPLSSHEYVS